MSAYAHQMEREFSAHSLSSGGGSGRGSNYVVESGFYITSFAATIFIAALITVGVSLVTLLIALTVMLQSCEDQTAGIVELQRLSDVYSYCKNFAFYAEFNALKPDEFPSDCRVVAYEYLDKGQYALDLNYSVRIAENYFSNVKPSDSGVDVVLLDIDDLLPSAPGYVTRSAPRFYRYQHIKCLEDAINLKKMLLLKLFTQLTVRGWSVILLSRENEKVLNSTKDYLYSAGFRGWSSLIMRIDEEMHISSREYFYRRRMAVQNEGHHISGIISSQMDAMSGPCLGQRVFKLPNLMYYEFVNPVGGTGKVDI